MKATKSRKQAKSKQPKLFPKFIRRRGGKITIDLDRAGQAAEDAGDVTVAFLERLGQDGLKAAQGLRDYLRSQGRSATDDVLRRRSA